MSAHTPGPWRLRNRPSEAPDDMIVMSEIGDGICDTRPSNPMVSVPQAIANARLIALAPEMLDALRALVDKPLRYHDNRIEIECDSHIDAMRRVNNARAILTRLDGAK